MTKVRPVTIDFETHGIEGRPDYPPKPVGVSIKLPGKRPEYYAWGHPTENNCTEAQAKAALKKVWGWKDGLLFQNAKFDLDVAEVHLGLKMPDWRRTHDTLYLIFLDDPNQTTFSLKPSAERLLGMKPEEQDAVGEWLIKNQPVPGVKISKSQSSPHYFGRYIALAPGKLVGKYANGDVVRTDKLFDLLHPKTLKRGMGEAYDRERRLMPVLLETERQGLPVDLPRLHKDVASYERTRADVDRWVAKRLKVSLEDINLDSGEQLVQAMIEAGRVDADLLPRTPTGKYQTNKEALLVAVTDRQLLAVLKYRTQLNTCMNTFMMPWLKVAKRSKGLIYTTWNQTKSTGAGGGAVGARTGRLSSTPNFQNIPKEFAPIFAEDLPAKERRSRKLPSAPLKLPPLPNIRRYVVPFKGEVLVDRDFSQQEPRILVHFDGGALMKKYVDDPWVDFHDYARAELAKMGKYYDRKPVKNTNLGLIYGMGVGKLADKNNMPVEEASELKRAILELYPGLKQMYQDMKVRASENTPIRTWGGREYFCEPPKFVEGRMRQFDYKLVNVLIQGSAADCTKEAILRFEATRKKNWRLLLNVHDQLTVSAPKREAKAAMECLREAMEGVQFDVPMLSEGSMSDKSWADLKDYDKKGKVLR